MIGARNLQTMTDRSLCVIAAVREPTDDPGRRIVALLVDLAPGWSELAAEWLADAGFAVGCSTDATAPAVVLLELAYPRRDGAQQVASARARWPAAAVLLLSPTFHPGVACDGQLAQALGADAVVALPTSCETLLGAVRRVLRAPR